jgi:hypothetical protein
MQRANATVCRTTAERMTRMTMVMRRPGVGRSAAEDAV